ncbi:MAG: isoprenylcysteine carboxylmethyltransferase family protein [Spirochaetes bacterium]|nr:isoprenylcysteine carboxylmethyltransferase family protein [Spirochaetota bacterium]
MSSFDWFQLVMLGLFLLVFGGRTIMLSLKGTRIIVLGAGKGGFGAVLEIAFLAGLLAWCWEIIVHALRLDMHLLPGRAYAPLFRSDAVASAGAVMIAAGFVFFVWALVSFGNSWRVGIDTRKPGGLVTGGAFALSRNPIFLFMDLYFTGTFLVTGTPFFLAFALVTVAGIHFQILQEERFLKGHYGDEYLAYAGSVRRYI